MGEREGGGSDGRMGGRGRQETGREGTVGEGGRRRREEGKGTMRMRKGRRKGSNASGSERRWAAGGGALEEAEGTDLDLRALRVLLQVPLLSVQTRLDAV